MRLPADSCATSTKGEATSDTPPLLTIFWQLSSSLIDFSRINIVIRLFYTRPAAVAALLCKPRYRCMKWCTGDFREVCRAALIAQLCEWNERCYRHAREFLRKNTLPNVDRWPDGGVPSCFKMHRSKITNCSSVANLDEWRCFHGTHLTNGKDASW